MEIQSTSEMTPYFTMNKYNKLFITFAQLNAYQTLPSSISTILTISMTVVMTTLFNTHAQCSMKYKGVKNGLISHTARHRKMYRERGRYVIGRAKRAPHCGVFNRDFA